MQHKWLFLAIMSGLGALALTGCTSTSTVVASPNQVTLKKDPEKAMQTRVQLAAEYIRSGDLDAAKRSLDQALEIHGRHAEANMMMGILLQTEGSPSNLAKADHYYRIAISSDPKSARIRLNYGTYLFRIKKYNESIENLKIAATTLGYEQRGIAWENLGLVYLALRDMNNAENAFKQAVQIDRTGLVRPYIELAEIFYLKSDFDNAAAAYEQYQRMLGNVQLDPHALWIGLRIARAFKDTTRMQIIANEMRALYPDSPEYKRYLQLKNSPEVVWK